MMTWLRKLLMMVAGIALALGAGGWLIDHNVFQSQVVLVEIHKSDSCEQIAAAAPQIMVQALALPATSQPLLKGVVSSDYVCDRLDQLLPQFDAYYRHDGPPPQIDLRDLMAQLSEAGVPLPPAASAKLAVPITYSNAQIDGPLRDFAQLAQRSMGLSLAVAAAGMIILWLISAHKRWQSVAGVWLVAAVGLAAFAGLIRLAPTLVASPVASSWLSDLAPSIKGLATAVTTNASRQLLIAAAGSAVLAVALWLLGAVTGWRSRHPGKPPPVTLADSGD